MNANMTAATLPAAILALNYRQTVEMFRRLGGGAAGFDYGKYKLGELREVAAAWIVQGVPAALMEAHASAIAAEATAARTMPAPPAALSVPAPAAALPQPDALTATQAAALQSQAAHDAAVAADPAHEFAARPSVPAVDIEAAQDSVRASILAAIAAPPVLPGVPMTMATLPAAPIAAPFTSPPTESETIAAALAETALTHPAAALPPMADAPDVQPATPAPAGREYARTLFRDLPAAVREAIPATLTVPVYSHPDAETPDTNYRFNAATLVPALIAMATTPAMRAWFSGPRGTGKTEFARQIAARTGRALFRVNFSRFTEGSEIIGDMGLVGGNTVWQDGPVAKAVREAARGAVLLLDEITYCTPGALSCLNPLLERNGATLRLPRTGEALPVPADLFVIAADNTFGTGDASGEYAARNELGADTRDRFSVKLQFDYLPAADERALLRDAVQRECGRKPTAAALAPLLKILHVAREKAGLGELQGAPSFRGAVAFATLLAYGLAPAEAYTLTIVHGAPEESHEALRTIFSAHWPTNAQGGLASFFEGA